MSTNRQRPFHKICPPGINRFENVRFHKNYKLLTVTCTSNFNKHENNEAWLYRPGKKII